MPELDKTIEVEIREDMIKMDTFRSGGAGGHNVNKVSQKVYVTHIPTGKFVQSTVWIIPSMEIEIVMKRCCRLSYHKWKKRKAAEVEFLKNEKKEITWGGQIRVLMSSRLILW